MTEPAQAIPAGASASDSRLHVGGPAPGAGRPRRGLRRRSAKSNHVGARIAFLSPAVLIIGAFTIAPIALSFWISLHKWSMYTPLSDMPWVGLDNYTLVFASERHLQAAANTFWYVLASVAVTLPLAFLLALLLYFPRLKGQGIVRVILFATYILPTIAVAIIWGNLYASYGPISGALQGLGITAPSWLNTPSTALMSLVVFNVWQMVGYYVVLLIAGMTQISEDLYEAARLDGAGFVRQTVSITIPMLRTTLVFVAVMTALNSIQMFDPVYLLTLGGPLNSTNVISYDIQRTAFQDGLAGQASALAFSLFVLLAIAGSAIAAVFRKGRVQ